MGRPFVRSLQRCHGFHKCATRIEREMFRNLQPSLRRWMSEVPRHRTIPPMTRGRGGHPQNAGVAQVRFSYHVYRSNRQILHCLISRVGCSTDDVSDGVNQRQVDGDQSETRILAAASARTVAIMPQKPGTFMVKISLRVSAFLPPNFWLFARGRMR